MTEQGKPAGKFSMTITRGASVTIHKDGELFFQGTPGTSLFVNLDRAEVLEIQNVIGNGDRQTEDALAGLAAEKASARATSARKRK